MIKIVNCKLCVFHHKKKKFEKKYLLPQYSTLENRGIGKKKKKTTISHKVIDKFDYVKGENSTGQRSVYTKSKDNKRGEIFSVISNRAHSHAEEGSSYIRRMTCQKAREVWRTRIL